MTFVEIRQANQLVGWRAVIRGAFVGAFLIADGWTARDLAKFELFWGEFHPDAA